MSAIIPVVDWSSQGNETSACTDSLPLTGTRHLQNETFNAKCILVIPNRKVLCFQLYQN